MGKRIRAIAALATAMACLALVLGGCSSSNYQPALKDPTVASPAIGQAGTLRVGVDTANPPLAGMGSDKIIGIDVDIAAALADRLGLKLSIVDVGSDPEGALAEGKVDLVMGIDQSEGGDFWRLPAHGRGRVRHLARCRRADGGRLGQVRRADILQERLGRDQRVRRVGAHLHH